MLVADRATAVGVFVRQFIRKLWLPASFFTCDENMRAPAGNFSELVLEANVAPHERWVIVDDYLEPTLRGRSRRSFLDVDWAYRSELRPVPRWIFKLPVANHQLHLTAVLPFSGLHLIENGPEVLMYDLMPELEDD